MMEWKQRNCMRVKINQTKKWVKFNRMIKYLKMMAMRTGKIINEIFDNQLFFLMFYFIYF